MPDLATTASPCSGGSRPATELECRLSGADANRALIKKTLNAIKGTTVLAIAAISTVVWFTPLMVFALLKLLVPLAAFRRTMTRWIMAVGEHWISCNALIFGAVNSTKYDIRGVEGLSRSSWYLVIVNHQTWIDIIALQIALNRRIPFLKFFIKQQLIWFPVLGIAFWAMDMPFMKRHSKSYLQQHPGQKGRDLEATRKACLKFNDTPTSVINFIEGTRFSEKKRIKRDSPYRHLLPPRSGGIAVALSSMGSMFDAILDVTIFYPRGVPQFWDILCGRFGEVVIDVTQRPIEGWIVAGDYLNDRAFRREFHRWLKALWAEKDTRLSLLHSDSS